MDAIVRVSSDAGEDGGEPGLRIDVVEASRLDQRDHDGGAFGAAVGAGEQPCPSAQSQTTQGSFGSIVRQADPSVLGEAGEVAPALEHVVDRFGDGGRPREPGALLAQPFLQIDQYWSNVWNKEPFCTTFIFGRPTQDQVYSLSYLSSAEWNDTRFHREDFDRLILGARGELDQSVRKEMYHDATVILRDNGGAIIPMFGDFIDATGPRIDGWVDNPNGELMGGQALMKCWLKS